MPALNLDMTIPLGDAGQVRFSADIDDLGQLSERQRQVLADTAREFAEFAAATIALPSGPAGTPPAEIHDPGRGVLAGVNGGRGGGRA